MKLGKYNIDEKKNIFKELRRVSVDMIYNRETKSFADFIESCPEGRSDVAQLVAAHLDAINDDHDHDAEIDNNLKYVAPFAPFSVAVAEHVDIYNAHKRAFRLLNGYNDEPVEIDPYGTYTVDAVKSAIYFEDAEKLYKVSASIAKGRQDLVLAKFASDLERACKGKKTLTARARLLADQLVKYMTR